MKSGAAVIHSLVVQSPVEYVVVEELVVVVGVVVGGGGGGGVEVAVPSIISDASISLKGIPDAIADFHTKLVYG